MEKITKATSYKLQFIDSTTFMVSSLSNFKIKFIKLNAKMGIMIKNVKHVK